LHSERWLGRDDGLPASGVLITVAKGTVTMAESITGDPVASTLWCTKRHEHRR
jgi:hypothetical protein